MAILNSEMRGQTVTKGVGKRLNKQALAATAQREA
jgi:hypothetical protein